MGMDTVNFQETTTKNLMDLFHEVFIIYEGL